MKNQILSSVFLVSMFLSASTTLASEGREIPSMTHLAFLQASFQDVCKAAEGSNFDCYVSAWQVDARKPGDSIADTVRKVMTTEYVDDVSTRRLSKKGSAIHDQLKSVAGNAGIDPKELDTLPALDQAFERLDNDVYDDSRSVAVAGHATGAFDMDHEFLAIFDTRTNQVLVITAGYSE